MWRNGRRLAALLRGGNRVNMAGKIRAADQRSSRQTVCASPKPYLAVKLQAPGS